MKTHHTYLTYLPALAIILILATGCNKKSTDKSSAEITETPPSISGIGNNPEVIVSLSEKEATELNITTEEVKSENVAFRITAPGLVAPAQNFVAVISAPVEGRIVHLPVQVGDRVRKGQVILELESLTFGTLVAEYLQALSEDTYQKNQLERIAQLVEKRINPESELDRVKSDEARATAGVKAAYARLRAVGVSDQEIEMFKGADKINPRLKVFSPIDGVINSHQGELGQSVDANQQIAVIYNLDVVQVKSYLVPEDADKVNPGDSVWISHRLLGDNLTIGTTIRSINPGLDENNRSLVVNTIVKNSLRWLKPGDNVRTEILSRIPRKVLSVPMSAVTYINNDAVVFVNVGLNKYQLRKVTVDEIHEGNAMISFGLSSGERIATSQVFSLKALSRYDLIAEE